MSAPAAIRVVTVGDRRAVRRAAVRLEVRHAWRQARRARRAATPGRADGVNGSGATN